MPRLTFDSPGQWFARVEATDFDRTLRMLIGRESGSETWPSLVVAPIEMQAYQPHEVIQPTAEFHAPEGRAMLQAIVDAAFEAGIRPKGADHTRETAAMRRHLEDMRTLVMDRMTTRVTLNDPLPKGFGDGVS